MGRVLSASISQGGNFAHHQIISCQISLPRIPRVATVSRERVALFHCATDPRYVVDLDLEYSPEADSVHRWEETFATVAEWAEYYAEQTRGSRQSL